MRSKVLQAMDIFADERHFRLRLFFEGLLIGALTGALIAVFRYLLEGSEDLRRLAYHWLRTAEPGWFLLYGAAFLLATSLTIILLLKYDSQNLAEAEEGIPKLNLVADVKYTVKQEQKTFAWILLLLPVAIISAGPLDQWQMYFQRGKTVNSGTISVLMSLAGMLAISLYNRYVSKKPLSNKGQTRLIVVSTVMMAATLLGVVGLKNWYYGSLALFMLHTMFGSLENMLGGIVLQTTIQTENRRATIMSVANALDAGAEVVILAINGFLSDRYGIGFAWVSLAVLGLVIFLLAIFGMQSKKLEVEEI
mgnify:CR=1 FL=1